MKRKVFAIIILLFILLCGCNSENTDNKSEVSSTLSPEQLREKTTNEIKEFANKNSIKEYVTADDIFDFIYSIDLQQTLENKFFVSELEISDIFIQGNEIYAKFNDFYNVFELKITSEMVEQLRSAPDGECMILAKINKVRKFNYEIDVDSDDNDTYDLDVSDSGKYTLYGECIAIR